MLTGVWRKGTIERIGGEAILRLEVAGHDPQRSTSSLRDINAAVDFIARWAASPESGIEEIKASTIFRRLVMAVSASSSLY